MAVSFHVEVVAADHKLFSGQVVSLIVPGQDGYFGVLSGHAPLIGALGIGELTITPADKTTLRRFAVSGGFAEVTQDKVIILTDTAELAEEIDVERARQSLNRASERLKNRKPDIDTDRATIALQRAINRLKVAKAL